MNTTNQPTQIAIKIAEYLRNHQDTRGTIFDVIDGEFTPISHYGIAFYALSAFLIFKIRKEERWYESGRRALTFHLDHYQKYTDGPDRGHKEFNDLAILLIYGTLDFSCCTEEFIKSLQDYILNSVPDRLDFRLRMPNNWMAIRAVCCALKSKYFTANSYLKSRRLFEKYILSLQLKDGIFYDYPPRFGLISAETPLVYHAKICAMLAMGYEIYRSHKVLQALIRGLDALAELISPDGEAFYYGRTNNGIFGYAGAVYAYNKAAGYLSDADQRKVKYIGICNLFLNWIKKWQFPDGHVAIVPNINETERMGWDNYMHNTVYNAYAATMLLLTGEVESLKQYHDTNDFFYAQNAGLLKLNRSNKFYVLSTTGQKVNNAQGYGHARYKGLTIYKFMNGGKDVIAPPEIEDAEGVEDLSLTDKQDHFFVCSNIFSNLDVIKNNRFFVIVGHGELIPKHLYPISPAKLNFLNSELNRFVESKIPQICLPTVYSILSRVKSLKFFRKKNTVKFFKSIVIDFENNQILWGYYIKNIKNIREAKFCLNPPILSSYFDLVSINHKHSATPDLVDTVKQRILKTSKGLAIQKYLSLNVKGAVDTLWVVSRIDFLPRSEGNQFPIDISIEKELFKVSKNIIIDFSRPNSRITLI